MGDGGLWIRYPERLDLFQGKNQKGRIRSQRGPRDMIAADNFWMAATVVFILFMIGFIWLKYLHDQEYEGEDND